MFVQKLDQSSAPAMIIPVKTVAVFSRSGPFPPSTITMTINMIQCKVINSYSFCKDVSSSICNCHEYNMHSIVALILLILHVLYTTTFSGSNCKGSRNLYNSCVVMQRCYCDNDWLFFQQRKVVIVTIQGCCYIVTI